ncbi:MAG: hypothetical protein OYK82_12640 [Gammaproteobacteria bacterium]|nr:hypothetical protein [Gammaproteobacteria bacterium]
MTELHRFPAAPPHRARPGSARPPRALVLLLLPLAGFAGGAGAQAPPVPDPGSPEALMAEYREVQSRLGQLQVQVIRENAELAAHRSAIDELVTAAMRDFDAETDTRIARLEELSGEAMAAQRAQDTEAVQALMGEIAQHRTALNAAQEAAVAREDVRSEIESFEAALMARLREVDPEAPELQARLDELVRILSGGGPGGR